ncbi:MAG: LytTR family DNA-binding domain-containing protein [Bacteroidota bacterium]
MRVIVVDDERLARKELISLLEAFESVEIVAEATNGDEAFELISKEDPDVVFLDIQMPGMTGFEVLEKLESVPQVVFTTAYDEFALKAFEVNALDYLLKPIQADRLAECVNKIDLKPNKKLSKNKKLCDDDQVFVKDGDKCWFVRLADVRLFESDGNYIKVYFDTFKPMIHKSLNALDEKLDDRNFFRASRKHIINLTWIEKIDTWFNGGLLVELKGGEKIEVSRRQSARFREMMSL